jgi:hypothetical protein
MPTPANATSLKPSRCFLCLYITTDLSFRPDHSPGSSSRYYRGFSSCDAYGRANAIAVPRISCCQTAASAMKLLANGPIEPMYSVNYSGSEVSHFRARNGGYCNFYTTEVPNHASVLPSGTRTIRSALFLFAEREIPCRCVGSSACRAIPSETSHGPRS